MALATVSPLLLQQINRVRRRLFLQQLLTYLVWSLLGALTASALWFLVQPLVIQDAAPWLRWTVLGAAVAAVTAGSIVVAVLKAPSAVTAALSLDERFQLRERVTTSLTLEPAMVNSPAGQALLADVQRRLDPVRVGDRFPVQVPWTAWLVPAGAAAIALLAVFYNPVLNTVSVVAGDEKLAVTAEEKTEIQKKLDRLKKPAPKPNEPRPRSQELANLEMELDKLAHKPHDTKDEASELISKMTEMEDKIKKQQHDAQDKDEARKEAMKQLDKVMKKQPKNGPADELRKAIDKNDMQKAEEELDKLAQKLQAEDKAEKLKKKLEDPNLTKEDREKTQKELDKTKDQQLSKEQKEALQDQVGEMKDKLDRLARKQEEDKEKEKDLKEKAKNGEIDPDQLKKELDDLDKGKMSDKDMQDLKDLADKLGECQQCMKDGKNGEAGKKLSELADEMDRLDSEASGDRKALKKKLEELKEAKKSLCEGCDGQCDSEGRNMKNKGGIGKGPRDYVEDDNTGSKKTRERSQLDNSKVNVVDHVPGQGMKTPKSQDELREDIKRASQEAPEAIDRMRLPKSASDMTRGYFDKLRGSDKKPGEQPK